MIVTDNVVPFDKPKSETKDSSDGPHWVGTCLCGACSHEWEGTAPVGTEDHLECPNCKRFWGAAKHAVVPPVSLWGCDCGETLFWLTPKGAMCRRCGEVSSQWAE